MENEKEFEKLLRAANKKVQWTVRSILRGHEDHIDDVLQEASLSAWKHFDSFEERSTFDTWYTRIAINKALMFRRSQKTLDSRIVFEHSMQPIVADDGDELDIMSCFQGHFLNPEQLAIRNEQRAWLVNEIN